MFNASDNYNRSRWPALNGSVTDIDTGVDYHAENGVDSTGSFIRLWVVGVFGTLVSAFTVFGNLMVIVAVIRERNLRNATNLYVFSLAVADLIMGLLVMPFSVINDTIQWPLNLDACDAWRATDVFLSTASIMHLCVIAIERYSAITNPIGHYVTRTKLIVSIVLVWLVSLCISYPAIIWWRATRGEVPPGVCPFTEDTTYLVVSSIISFYLPSGVMVFVYVKILRTAQRLTAGLRNGKLEIRLPQSMSKKPTENGSASTASTTERVTVRVHTGCRHADTSFAVVNGSSVRDDLNGTTHGVSPYAWRRSVPSCRTSTGHQPHIPEAFNTLPSSRRQGIGICIGVGIGVNLNVNDGVNNTICPSIPISTALSSASERPVLRFDTKSIVADNAKDNSLRVKVANYGDNGIDDDEERDRQILMSSMVRTPCDENKSLARSVTNGHSNNNNTAPPRPGGVTKSRSDSISASSTRREQHKRKIQHEQKAAKTIAFIICLFIVSWTPFFLCNLVAAISPTSIVAPEITFVVVSWLGYTNSCMNFIIYSYSLTDFRVAFKKLFGCQPKVPRSSYHIPQRWQYTDSTARQKQGNMEYSSYYHSNVIVAEER